MASLDAVARHADAVSAWREALTRCLHTRSHALVDGSAVLVFADAPRVFHPAQALVNDADHRGGHDDGDATPFVVVARLHPQIAALLSEMEKKVAAESIDAVVQSVVFREQATATASGVDASVLAAVPFFASKAVNVDGGALYLYGETEQSASEALAMVTLAISSCGDDERLVTDSERLTVVVEHHGGYLARDYVLSADADEVPAFPRLIHIQKREWNSGSIAQLSLDDALESFEAAYLEEQEISGEDADAQGNALAIDVEAAFEVRDQSRSALDSAFLMDGDDLGGPSLSPTSQVPPVVLFSKWEGLENVRSLLCKPPPQSASAICISGNGRIASRQRATSSCQSLVLLQHLEQAIRDGTGQRSWRTTDTETTAAEIVQSFKRLLHNIDQDDFLGGSGGGDDNLNNTIESTISMALDGERERAQTAASRNDLDPVEKLWDFLTKNADGTDLLLQILQEFMVFLSNTRVFPAPHPDNDTELARLMRLRHEEIQGNAATSTFAASAQQILSQTSDAFALVIEAGEWKMKRDVAFALAQAGFSSQEGGEFVDAMPRFDRSNHSATHVHWKAMDQVLQLCSSGQSVLLPVAFMRKAVHDCVAFYARGGSNGGAAVDPSILIDLQSFIPDRLRANIADPLYWDLSISFNSDFMRRLRICQDAFHPTMKPTHGLSGAMGDELVLDDATLRALHRNTPESMLMEMAMVKFMTKLEDDREKRLYEQLHDIEMPTGMTRYDCTMRRLHVFP